MANNTGNKFGGRKKGTPNKSNQEIKEMIIDLIGDPIILKMHLNGLDPSESVRLKLSLLKYIAPTLKAIEVETAETKNINIAPIEWV
jgi:hypothetical protein